MNCPFRSWIGCAALIGLLCLVCGCHDDMSAQHPGTGFAIEGAGPPADGQPARPPETTPSAERTVEGAAVDAEEGIERPVQVYERATVDAESGASPAGSYDRGTTDTPRGEP